jgi:hypothetical protein
VSFRPVDDFEIEYHLTPHGWKRGCEWFFGELQAQTPAPPDRVLTLRKKLLQRSAAEEKDICWSTIWKDPEVPESALEQLQSRYRRPES